MANECYFLSVLPTEIRLRIYEYILRFEKPLKLRQVVAGSKNTGILRANRQIHSEALSILFDVNTIIVSRNDFCLVTDPELQTPFRRDQVRHLLVRNFSQSIRCSSYSGGNNVYLAGCCDVCKPSAAGFITGLTSLPRIQTVIIDYHHHSREFGFIRDTIRRIGSIGGDAEYGVTMTCIGIARYRLTSPSIPTNLSIIFTDVPFHTIWSELFALDLTLDLTPELAQSSGSDSIRSRLREEVDRELTDKLYHFLLQRHIRAPSSIFYCDAMPLWQRLADATRDGEDLAAPLEALTEQAIRHCNKIPTA